MMRIGCRILEDSKRETEEGGTFEIGRGRDLLSLIVQANTSNVSASQQLSEKDVMARTCFYFLFSLPGKPLSEVPTFLVAGHETTRYVFSVQFRHGFAPITLPVLL